MLLIFCFLSLKGEMSVTDNTSWKPDAKEAQSASEQCDPHVPGVQDPLGSSVMTWWYWPVTHVCLVVHQDVLFGESMNVYWKYASWNWATQPWSIVIRAEDTLDFTPKLDLGTVISSSGHFVCSLKLWSCHCVLSFFKKKSTLCFFITVDLFKALFYLTHVYRKSKSMLAFFPLAWVR